MKIDQTFYLSGNNDFSNRQKQVFAELDRLGSAQPENRYTEQIDESRKRRHVDSGRRETRRLCGQESLFRAAPDPIKRRSAGSNLNFVPDFVKHPTKWKKYHLGDDVMSEKSNQAAAMTFLKEIKERQKKDEGESSMFKVPQRVAFNRHINADDSSKTADQVEAIEKPTFVDGKLTMPEYVVGLKKKTVRAPRKSGVVAAGTAVKLDHLEDEEEGE